MGRVYGVMQPPCDVELVKVGKTTKTVAERMSGNVTFQPHPLVVIFDEVVPNEGQVEAAMHRYLKAQHFNKEWFELDSPEQWEQAFAYATGRSLGLWPRLKGRVRWTWALARDAYIQVLAVVGLLSLIGHALLWALT